MEEKPESSKKTKKSSSGLWKIVAVFTVILLAATIFFAWKYNSEKKQVAKLSNPQNAIKLEADDLKAKVGQLVDLPDEQPTVATVTDVTKLQGQTFFAKAENGDKVLIFPTAGRAVLYRPSTNKVIEYAPVNLNTSSGTTTTTTKK